MKLLLDIGNSRIKWAYEAPAGLIDVGEIEHHETQPDAAMDFLQQLPQAPDAVAVVNVAGDAMENALRAALKQQFSVDPWFLKATARCGEVINGYAEAGLLGVDRWAAVVGAWEYCRSDVCIVDAGTALTIDLVLASGQHRGGIIVPGLAMMRAVLGSQTGNIARFTVPGDDHATAGSWYGNSTRTAVEKGARMSLLALVDRAFEEFAAESSHPALLLTGGNASTLAPLLQHSAEVRPMLVIEGLAILAAGSENSR